MLDQGFTQLHTDWELRGVVDDCIEKWCARNGRKPEDMPLLLAFSHSCTRITLPPSINSPIAPIPAIWASHTRKWWAFWGMTNYPEERVTLDLGGRDILIWGSPGHVISEFAYYDTYTQILYTGDMFYRGRCYISFWDQWFDSMKRLIAFVDTHPVTHVIGCHAEISRTGEDYSYGITYQPDEAPVQLTVAELRKAYEVAKTSYQTRNLLYGFRLSLQPDAPERRPSIKILRILLKNGEQRFSTFAEVI